MHRKIANFLVSTVLAIGLVVALPFTGKADSRQQVAKEISKQFAAAPSMSGEFIQFGPNGEQTGGEFFIQRPGKIRLNYEEPSPLSVISNGRTLAVTNKKLKTRQFFPLRKTPLSLLLGKTLEVNDKSVLSVDAGQDMTRVVLGDKSLFGNSEITLLFDPATYDLRQWTIKDAQGKETSVMIFNVQKNVKLSKKLFKVSKTRRKSQR